MSAFRMLVPAWIAVAACGDDGGAKPVDAKAVDAAVTTVVAVTCPATPAATITATNLASAYMPAASTIGQGQVVKFTMPTNHNVAPLQGMSDPGLTVNFGEEKCLMFTATGTFKFMCTPHGFTGMITVN